MYSWSWKLMWKTVGRQQLIRARLWGSHAYEKGHNLAIYAWGGQPLPIPTHPCMHPCHLTPVPGLWAVRCWWLSLSSSAIEASKSAIYRWSLPKTRMKNRFFRRKKSQCLWRPQSVKPEPEQSWRKETSPLATGLMKKKKTGTKNITMKMLKPVWLGYLLYHGMI